MDNIRQIVEIPYKKFYITNTGDVFDENHTVVSLSLKNDYKVLVVIAENGINTYRFFIHRLVAKYFIDNPQNYKYLLHKNKDKKDNNYSNLMWCKSSCLPGTDHSFKDGTQTRKSRIKSPVLSFPDETWKEHPFLKDVFISTNGRIRRRNCLYSLKGVPNHYQSVVIVNKTYKVHRLVAQTYLTPPSDQHIFVNHKDGNRSNNKLSNLEWITPRGNSQDRYSRSKKNLNTQEEILLSYNHLKLTPDEFKNQVWKVIPVLDNSYYASNKGMIKRIIFDENGNVVKEYFKLAEQTSAGYYECRLSIKKNYKLIQERKGIHSFVALAWIDNPERKRTVNHIDRNIHNNRVENLEWNTTQEQNIHKNITKKYESF